MILPDVRRLNTAWEWKPSWGFFERLELACLGDRGKVLVPG